MKLVDADKARECFGGDGVTGAVMQRMFDSLPTIDAVPVVRCWACKYHKPIDYCTKHKQTGWFDDDFCSYGQRKEADHEVSEL